MNEFNSKVCISIEQSQRLLELGLKPETADMLYIQIDGSWICIISQGDEEYIPYEDRFPAWSLHRLLEMYVERYISCNVNLKELTFDWLIDEIEIHVKENDFNKEYLKQ